MRKSRPGSAHRGNILQWLRRRTLVTVASLLMAVGVLFPTPALAAPALDHSRHTETAQVYTVEPGDSLGSIAMMFGVSQAALMQANMLRNPNMIYVGQQLIVPEHGGMEGDMGGDMGGPECATYYTVRRGDTLSEIAQMFGLDTYDVARANGVYDLNEVYVGQDLCIPASRGMGGPDKGMGMPSMEGPQRPMGEPDKGMGMPPMDGPQRPMDGWDRPGKPDLRPTEYWTGTYFTDKYFGEYAMTRQDLEVNFNWSTGSPFGNANENRFSVRWEKVEFFKGGPYTFYAVADDGVRVYVDDQLIIDAWKIQPATEYKPDIHLGEGPHKLVVEYYEEAEDAQIHVYWEPKRPNR